MYGLRRTLDAAERLDDQEEAEVQRSGDAAALVTYLLGIDYKMALVYFGTRVQGST